MQITSLSTNKNLIAEKNNPQELENALDVNNDAQALSVWLRSKANASTHTFDSYKREAHRLLLWLQENGLSLQTMKVDHAHQFYNHLANPPTNWLRPRKPAKDETLGPTQVLIGSLSAKSIKHTRTVLGSMASYLIDAGYMRYNVFRLSMAPSVTQNSANLKSLQVDSWSWLNNWLNERSGITPREIATINRNKWLITLLYHTGIRRSEAAKGVMGDFIKLDNGWSLRVIGKGNKERLISVNSILLKELVKYRKSLNLDTLPYPGETTPLVCSIQFNQGLTGMSARNIGLIIESISEAAAGDCDDEYIRAQIQKMSTHWFRHTNATHRLIAGASLETTQDELGHADPRTTRIYAQTVDTKRQEDAQKLADMQG